SQLTLSGNLLGGNLTTQSAGSLTTSFTGRFHAELSGTQIAIGSHVLSALNKGSFAPGAGVGQATSPANFGSHTNAGALGNANQAFRDVALTMNATSPLTLTGSNFTVTGLGYALPQMRIDVPFAGATAS